ncbi:uncharacterized protein BYT42DRAFT_606147 [Radiomyces spectabilis]|uniref:uncharacterized protein n=1 Tax=Radiomyces spectabilis TaxID=64574 RepID=UPI002220F92D|nr:uncharacterized protein BYT42DRAFT_606147 [Radiomyces spectabilis]KAI8374160.1 hypothetical protein BYT42DRAFT_606147 [Radiomyces spectabilis]
MVFNSSFMNFFRKKKTSKYPIAGKVAVITGASRGIGKAVAEALAERGAKVVIGDVLDTVGQTTTENINKRYGSHKHKVAVYQHTDVSKYRDLIQLFAVAEKEFGSVDIAILNAGTTKNMNALFTPLDDELEMAIYEVDVGGVVKGNKVAMLHMAEHGGVIVNTASMAGLMPDIYLNAYAACKHAVVGWTRSLAFVNKFAGIRVNAVCPGFVDTDMLNVPREGPNREPYADVAEVAPKTPMPVVVEAFLRCITDPSLAGDLLLALPDGVKKQPPYRPPESLTNKQMEERRVKYERELKAKDKAELAEAVKRFKATGR